MTADAVVDDAEAKEIDELMKKYQSSQEQSLPTVEGEEKKEIKPGILTKMLVSSLAGVSKILARKTDVKEWELDDHDQKDLVEALAPFESELYKLLQYIKYLPLAVFSIGYTFRVIDGMKNRKKNEKEKIEKEKQEKLKAAEEEKKLADKKEEKKEGDKNGAQPDKKD